MVTDGVWLPFLCLLDERLPKHGKKGNGSRGEDISPF